MLSDRSMLLLPTILFTLMGCAQTDLEARVARLEVEADRQAVIRLMHDYAHGLDAMDVPLLERTFAEDAVAHYALVFAASALHEEGAAGLAGAPVERRPRGVR